MTDPSVDLKPLFDASTSGDLLLSKSAADECAAACQSYIAGLELMRSNVTDAAIDLGGFGSLNSGLALQGKFSQLLVGGGETLSLVDVLTQHIDVANRLKAVFLKAGADYARTEHENTQMIVEAGG